MAKSLLSKILPLHIVLQNMYLCYQQKALTLSVYVICPLRASQNSCHLLSHEHFNHSVKF